MKNMISKLKFPVAFFLLLLSSCSPKFTPLPKDVQENIQSTDILSTPPQKSLNVVIEKRNASSSGTGLLGALIVGVFVGVTDSISANNSKDALRIIKAKVPDLQIESLLQEKIFNEIKDVPWLGKNQLSIYNDTIEDTLAIKETSDKDVLFFVTFSHIFSADLSQITGKLTLQIYPVSHKIKELLKDCSSEDPIYYISFDVAESLPNPDGKENNAKMWAANNGKLLKDSFGKMGASLQEKVRESLKNPQVDIREK